MHQLLFTVLVLFAGIDWLQASTVLSTRTITEKQGQDVVLACRFDRLTDRDRVMWSKDGVVLSVNQEISGDKRKYEIIGKYDLIVKSIASNDSGRYLCQNFDQALSMTVVLNVLTRPSKPELLQSNETLIEKTFALFICSTYGGNPLPTFTWLINQQPINQSFYLVAPSTSELRLPLEKQYHQAELTCQVNNKALDQPLSTSRSLNIQYKPEVNLRHGLAQVTHLNLLVVENDRLTLDCQVQSNPSISEPLTWLKNGASMTGINSPSLTLQTLKRNDEGEYTCLSSNAIGRGQASVHVRVQYAPIVRLTGGGLVRENQRLILTCIVDAYPPIDTYQWYKNDEKLTLTSSTSSLIIEKVSKHDAGIYTCLAKNTLKYSNGSAIEKSDKTQTRVTVEYAPIVHSQASIIAADPFTQNVEIDCQIDSYPDATVFWTFNQQAISNSTKYFMVTNRSSSLLTIRQLQSNFDYGFYSCNASNKLGNHSTLIQVRSKDVPEPPSNLTVISTTYSSISLQWQAGFDGGWQQSFWVSLDNSLWKETNVSHYTFNNLHHAQTYDVTVRAQNRLGQSRNSSSIRVPTADVPLAKEELPDAEQAMVHMSERTLDYRVNNVSFLSLKVPLCLRMEIYNRTNRCERLVTSSGVIPLEENDLLNLLNVSICLDQYDDYCGRTMPVEMKREVSFNWIFILIASILVVFFLILCGLCLFCLIQNCKRRRSIHQNIITSSLKKSPQHPIIIEPIHSPAKYFAYGDSHQQQLQYPSSFSKIAEIQKLDQLKDKSINRLIVTTTTTATATAAATAAAGNNGHFSSSASGSSDPIMSNANSSSLSGSDQLTVTDFYPLSSNPPDLSYKSYGNPNELPLSSAQNGLLWSQSQYGSYGFPFFSGHANSSHFQEIVSNKNTKEDSAESGYSTPSKAHHQSKKTVYEVVV